MTDDSSTGSAGGQGQTGPGKTDLGKGGVDAQVRRSLILHVSGGLLFVLSVLLIAQLLNRQAAQIRWVNHTYDVRQAISEMTLHVKNVESATRGFIGSGGSAIYLEGVPQEEAKALQQVEKIASLTSNNPEQRESVEKLRQLVDKKIKFNTTKLVDLSNADRRTYVVSLLRGRHEGFTLMRQIEVVAAEMRDREDRLLQARQRDVVQLQTWVCAASSVLALVAMVALVWSFSSSRQFLQSQAEKARLAQEAEETQRRIAQQLNRSNKDLQQFAYVASHDLQEPLRAVGGFLSLIAERHRGKLGDQTDRWIDQAVEGAERMRVLINDLLSFARVESRGGKITFFPAGSAVRKALENLSIAIEESRARIEVAELPEVWSDESQLIQVFQNLIGNAIKYRREEQPLITISCADEGLHWRFAVRDNGLGFDMEHAERIFVIFQRLYTRNEYTGTGIGLALCSRIIERHGGRIWATSDPGAGSTFFFTLPKSPETTAKELNEGD